MFGGIIQLTACHAQALEQAIKEFYNKHEIDINRLVMLTSDGASVSLHKANIKNFVIQSWVFDTVSKMIP